MFNNQVIDLNLKIHKKDLVFVVNTTSRLREMIGVVDYKNFTIYKNEKGVLNRIYSINMQMNEIKDI